MARICSGSVPALLPDVTNRLLRVVLATALAWTVLSCSQSLDQIGFDNRRHPVASVQGASIHKIFITTTREDSEVVGALFSELRADQLGLASVDVSIPPNHVSGELERPKTLPPDPRKEFAIIAPTIYETENAFIAAMNRELRLRGPSDRDILFFVHGYNTSTNDALLRVAQFVEDSGFNGVAVLFAWASAGKVSHYVYDLNSALIARPRLIDAASIVSRSVANEYHIFAHSMGCFLTMEALVDAVQTGQFNRTGRLREIVLASPDIDLDLFRSQMGQIDVVYDRLFVLMSQDDYALHASRLIAGGVPRLGAAHIEELSSLGVVGIDLSQIHDSASDSHSKFSGSPEVVQLLGQGLNAVPDYGSGDATLLDRALGSLPIRVVGGGG